MGDAIMPIRIQRRRTKGWRLPDGAICVDRSTGFGNPFPVVKCPSRSMGVTKDIWQIGKWGGPAMWFKDTQAEAVELAVNAYRAWLMEQSNETLREKARLVLRGHDLACWCALDQPCHASVLLEIANAPARGPAHV